MLDLKAQAQARNYNMPCNVKYRYKQSLDAIGEQGVTQSNPLSQFFREKDKYGEA
jgi:hypothetical protein